MEIDHEFLDHCISLYEYKGLPPASDTNKLASAPASFHLPLSLYEANRYYNGLHSRPVLVARTGCAWKLPTGPEAYTPHQELKTVGDHPLNAVWEDNLALKIHGILDSKGVKWTSTDVVRIGIIEESVTPVIVWIGVLPKTLSGADGLIVAKECKQLLVANDISDVEVHIRESVVTRYVGPKLRKPPSFNPAGEVLDPLTTTLGSSICKNSTSCVDGTGGFYVTDDNSRLYLVTARHVLFEPNPVNNHTYEHRSPNEPRIDVALFGTVGFNNYLERIKLAVAAKGINLEIEERGVRNTVEGRHQMSADEAALRRSYAEIRMNKTKEAIVASKKVYDVVEKDWPNINDRILGHVRFSPPIEHGVGPHKYTQDYALIEIDSSKIDASNFVGNTIDLGSVYEFIGFMTVNRKNLHAITYPIDGHFKAKGIIPDKELRHPTSLDEDDDPGLVVIKRGITTGLTVGRANNILSYVRYYDDNGDTRISKEWAIVSDGHKNMYDPFSEKGDSGSVIIDRFGRLGGLLTSGNIDITYATPVSFILDSLEANGYKVTVDATLSA